MRMRVPKPHLKHSRWVLTMLGVAAGLSASAQYRAVLVLPSGYASCSLSGIDGGALVGSANLTPQGASHALFWSLPSPVDLTPPGFNTSYAVGISGGSEVGYGTTPSTANRALLWTGDAAGFVDLHPAGFFMSQANAVSGASQVGVAYVSGTLKPHAILWHGSAAGFVDLNPPGFVSSTAYGVDGDTQVGSASFDGAFSDAVLWQGTAASAVDLDDGTHNSVAEGVWGDTQVGVSRTHAVLWHGTADSKVDLNQPAIMPFSYAFAIRGNTEVGEFTDLTIRHAAVWQGTAASGMDLHPFIAAAGITDPDGNPLVNSAALAVDADGTIAGSAWTQSTSYGILWVPIRTIAGTVDLRNLTATPAGTLATIEIRAPGSTTPLETDVVALDSNGGFTFTANVPPGTYDITAKASHWLRRKLPSQTLGVFGATGLAFSLTNGDINGDNSVSLADFGLLKVAYGSTSSSSNWNPNADLNGDGTVSLADFGILKLSYGQSGDN
ncbi:MAG TPA: dockerin type I domain-containing protein [Fimbriimonadaceae bacterium]|nr:dockerin type I domain-containing protein [Fimbriimonadaceae bacterium]